MQEKLAPVSPLSKQKQLNLHLPSISTDINQKKNLPEAYISRAYISKCRNKILVVPKIIQQQNHTSS